jgi:hypothetical protein
MYTTDQTVRDKLSSIGFPYMGDALAFLVLPGAARKYP